MGEGEGGGEGEGEGEKEHISLWKPSQSEGQALALTCAH